jgi:hypothetical protein
MFQIIIINTFPYIDARTPAARKRHGQLRLRPSLDILEPRKLLAGGVITTVAGIPGQRGFSGDGGSATSALLSNPSYDRF